MKFQFSSVYIRHFVHALRSYKQILIRFFGSSGEWQSNK